MEHRAWMEMQKKASEGPQELSMKGPLMLTGGGALILEGQMLRNGFVNEALLKNCLWGLP